MVEERDRQGIEKNWPEYEVEEVLGTGSFGKVYKIRRAYLNNVLYSAVKVIHIPNDKEEEENLLTEGLTKTGIKEYYDTLVQDFLKEIKILEQLKGASNILTIEDCIVEPAENGIGSTIYIKMELMQSFDEIMQDYEFDAQDVAKVGLDLCEALIVCEKKNIIHRDIKPENIFMNEFGDFKLGDFGIAREGSGNQTRMTQVGTGMYIAPELYRGEMADNRVDIYSLGIMLYRLANEGFFPFTNEDTMTSGGRQKALVRRLSGEALPLPSQVDEELGEIIIKACSFKADDRYRTAEELKKALERWKFQQDYSQNEEKTVSQKETEESKEKFKIAGEAPKEDKKDEAPNKTINIDTAKIEEGAKNVGKQIGKAASQAAETKINIKTGEKQFKIPLIAVAAAAVAIVVIAIIASTSSGDKSPAKTATAKAGDVIILGSYEQDGDTENGAEDIEWIVLDTEEDRLLVISKDALDAKAFAESEDGATWDSSSLRTWLNDDFYETAFAAVEQSRIVESTVAADENPDYETDAGEATQDKIFILSVSEAQKYFDTEEERECSATEYAKTQGIEINNSTNMCRYWLRTPGKSAGYAAYYIGGYEANTFGKQVTDDSYGVRPVMWVVEEEK